MDAGSVESVLAPPYLPIWRKVLAPQRPPVLLRHLVADMRAKAGGELPPGAALCFRGAPCHDAGSLRLACTAVLGRPAAQDGCRPDLCSRAGQNSAAPGRHVRPTICLIHLPQTPSSPCTAAYPSCPAPFVGPLPASTRPSSALWRTSLQTACSSQACSRPAGQMAAGQSRPNCGWCGRCAATVQSGRAKFWTCCGRGCPSRVQRCGRGAEVHACLHIA